jgi:phage protein D
MADSMGDNNPYPRALWQLSLDDKDLSLRLEPRLMSLTLTDNAGLEADQLDITLSDADGMLDIPERGVKLALALGRSDIGLIDKGVYTVDEVEHSGTPDQLTIKAKSANLRDTLLIKKERSWHKTTVGAIVKKIAGEHKLKPAVSPELAKMAVAHLDQQSESDSSLLTRLGEQFDALVTVKAGNLVFYAIGAGMSINGEPLPDVLIVRSSGDQHRFSVSDRDGCVGVTANYYDKKAGKQGSVTIREADLKKKTRDQGKGDSKVSAGGSNVKTLRHTYASLTTAKRGATAALKKALRGASTFTLSLAQGRPDIIPELAAAVEGWKPEIDSVSWRVTRVTHQLSPSGLTTDLELELRVTPPGTSNTPDESGDGDETEDNDNDDNESGD